MFPSLEFVNQLQGDLARDLLAFLPEIVLASAIVLMLLLRLFSTLKHLHLGYVAMAASVVSLVIAVAQWNGNPAFDPDAAQQLQIFSGLLVYDYFAVYVRMFLLAFVSVLLLLTLLTGIPDRDDSADFATLLLGSTLGMMMMASANHLLTVFIAIEMASVPSYALAGFLKGRRQGSEAALKYVVYGASASGIMLYGISLLCGKFGTGYLPDLALGYQAAVTVGGFDAVLIAGTLFVVVGIGYKLSAVPFHFWCPDVFEGAAAEVAAFLSVASKGAALALAARLFLSLAGPSGSQSQILTCGMLGLLLAAIAAATATLGNLAAMGQTNLKRLLAYSTIAHAGYMLMALAPLSANGAGAVLFYLMAYFLTNLGAFACVAFLRNASGSEDLESFAGLVHRSPALVITFAIFLLSLLGLPPLAGFAAKFQVFAVLFDAGHQATTDVPSLAYTYYALLILAGVNTVISAGYYLKILRVMVLDAPPAESNIRPVGFGPTVFTSALAVLVVAAGIFWNPLTDAANRAVEPLRPAIRYNDK
ncbi:MAG: NADH-quinone oxidoreductase subunit N [Planctomycetes bacterium]|nr:NADH-quinone oxidoreductase subunit N [Planctomycetota bacterium]